MPFRQELQELVEKITEKADVKKTFLRDLNRIPLKSCLNILEDLERLLKDSLPAGQVKILAGYRLAYYQLTSGEYRVIFRKDPWKIFFAFHKNTQKRILKHLH